jgi:ABC-type Fe3+-hydroxamate transport system substrate-binding protein
VFNDASTSYGEVSLEDVLARNPDVILELSGESRPKQDEVAALWRDQHTLKAVRTGRVYALASGAFLIPGPRAVEAATILFHLLHPEASL